MPNEALKLPVVSKCCQACGALPNTKYMSVYGYFTEQSSARCAYCNTVIDYFPMGVIETPSDERDETCATS